MSDTAKPARGTRRETALCRNCGEEIFLTKAGAWYHSETARSRCQIAGAS